jgi:hypothetical protein
MDLGRMSYAYVLQRANDCGVTTTSLENEMNQSAWHDSRSIEAIPALMEAATNLSGNPLFGFEVGQSLHPCLLGA